VRPFRSALSLQELYSSRLFPVFSSIGLGLTRPVDHANNEFFGREGVG
jgi:hypothetical protein